LTGLCFSSTAGTGSFAIISDGGIPRIGIASNWALAFTSGTNNADSLVAQYDTGVSRSAAGVVAIGATAAAGNTTGRVKAAGYMSVGTTFTSNGGCGDTTLVSRATAGECTTVKAGSCTKIITMGNQLRLQRLSCTATDLLRQRMPEY
jgi:hypothetical protein